MSDVGVGGITELQMLESEVKLLKKQLDGVQRAEKTSVASARAIASIQRTEEGDGFVGVGGGAAGGDAQNQYHSSAAAADGGGGCCSLM